MATARKSTKSTPVAEVEETVASEPTVKQTINAGIARVAEELGVTAANRYKVQRAIFFIAARDAIESGTFDELLDATIADVGELPSGFELERTVKAKVAPKAPVKKVAAKPAAKVAAKPAARKRPQR